MDKIEFFKGPYDFLSNFAGSPFTTALLPAIPRDPGVNDSGFDGICPTLEHAYQALKTQHLTHRLWILKAVSAGAAKKRGRHVIMRPDWDKIKLSIMEQLVLEKFEQNPDLADRLLATGDAILEEGNWWGDTFWGICRGVGENHLGKILMRVREKIRGSRK